VDHIVYAVNGPCETALVSQISYKPTQSRVIPEKLSDFILLQFVARVYDQAAWAQAVESVPKEGLAERASASRNEDT
jgi:hypothetical protein